MDATFRLPFVIIAIVGALQDRTDVRTKLSPAIRAGWGFVVETIIEISILFLRFDVSRDHFYNIVVERARIRAKGYQPSLKLPRSKNWYRIRAIDDCL